MCFGVKKIGELGGWSVKKDKLFNKDCKKEPIQQDKMLLLDGYFYSSRLTRRTEFLEVNPISA